VLQLEIQSNKYFEYFEYVQVQWHSIMTAEIEKIKDANGTVEEKRLRGTKRHKK